MKMHIEFRFDFILGMTARRTPPKNYTIILIVLIS